MPTQEEVQAVLDVLFNEKSLRWEYELRMRHESYRFSSVPKVAIHLFGKIPKRLFTGWAKTRFDEHYREHVRERWKRRRESAKRERRRSTSTP